MAKHLVSSYIVFIIVLFFIEKSYAVKTTGRITLGATAVTERYTSTDFGSNSNDILLASTRYFYKVSDVGTDKWEFVTDLRDKHDAFGKLNKELLQLEPKNEFQVRQLSSRWLNPLGSVSAQFGRFQVPEAGAIFIDGALGEFRFSDTWRSGLLAGLNPKSIEKSYLEFNANAQQYGTYLTYQSKDKDWDENLYSTTSLMNQSYFNKTERSFFYNSTAYQWQDDSRIISSTFVDFAPTTQLQTLNILYQQKINDYYSTELGILHIDVLEYMRVQNVLEKLAPSPYDEGRMRLEYKFSDEENIALSYTSGVRKVDNLKKDDISIGYDLSYLMSKKFDIHTTLGFRNNFTSKDTYYKLGFGYFSKNWEIYLDNQIEQDKNLDGTSLQPLTTEFGVTSYFSKELFLTASVQRAAEEGVTILSTFLKIGYRFGNQEVPPVRDGAPPRGAL